MRTDTIAAIATAVSNGGISIIRISGEDTLNIIDKIYRSKNGKKRISEQVSHTIHYGYIVDGEDVIDEVMVALMKGPNSYTREDVVEIQCHGGIVVTKKILQTVLNYGARIAEPGEFTKRAFLNGRIDLSQAEAIGDIINAKNEYALKNSLNQLKGNVLDKIKDIRRNVLLDIAFIEAALDDPEQLSLDNFTEKLQENLDKSLSTLKHLLKSSDNGRLLKEGIKTVILGKPNAGKSSLLNILVGSDRAIVTDIAGTTRDTLEETITLGGICLNVIDTAGIRETEDIIEKIGIDKARETAKEADLVIYVVDCSRGLDDSDKLIMDIIKDRTAIILLNKTDLDKVVTKEDINGLINKEVIEISAKERVGIEQLEQTIIDMFFEGKISLTDEIYITNLRHKEALSESIKSLEMVINSIEAGMPEDFFAIDMMNAYEVLGAIIGEAVDEDLVNTIFKEFCMGK